MKRVLAVLFFVLLIAYPLGIFYALKNYEPRAIGIVLVLLFFGRYILAESQSRGVILTTITIVGMISGILIGYTNHPLLLKFNPVFVNLALTIIFLSSLFRPPSIIESIARLQTPNLSSNGVEYTRKVTIAWSIFFLVNAAIASYTAIFSSIEIWTVYNGLIAYLLIGLFFLVEFNIRRFAMRSANE